MPGTLHPTKLAARMTQAHSEHDKDDRDISRPAQGFQRHFREKVRPARLKTAFFGHFGFAGRTFSRTGRSNVAALKPTTPLQPLTWASMKPPSPLRAPEQQPLKPTTPLQPKNGLKTPISHPQRRSRFHSHTDTSEQRRRRGQAAAPMGSGEAWPGDRWPADVTNVVKPTRFQSPCDGFCYKRRQSKPKNH